MVVLVDTNVISFIFKGDSRAQLYAPHLQGRQLAVSFMTVAELYQWAAVRQWGKRRIDQLTQTLRADYTVLDFDIILCQLWGQVRAGRRAIGQPISPEDAWIAATALHYNLPLVTHNPDDFENIKELQVITMAS